MNKHYLLFTSNLSYQNNIKRGKEERGKEERGKEESAKEVGVFAFRTPRRTSRIAVSQIELIRVTDFNIYVKGLDTFEDSPVLDIKAIKKSQNKT